MGLYRRQLQTAALISSSSIPVVQHRLPVLPQESNVPTIEQKRRHLNRQQPQLRTPQNHATQQSSSLMHCRYLKLSKQTSLPSEQHKCKNSATHAEQFSTGPHHTAESLVTSQQISQPNAEHNKSYQEKTTIIKPRQEKDAYHLLDRSDQMVLARLRSGHNRLNAHMHRKLKIVPSPTCLCGEEDQTIEHVLQRCNRHQSERIAQWPSATRKNRVMYPSRSQFCFRRIIKIIHIIISDCFRDKSQYVQQFASSKYSPLHSLF